jgi:hydrogenase nickel incorporation protein HypB
MTNNTEKRSAVTCELCNLERASTESQAAEDQGRETLAAMGSALVRNDRVASGNRDYLDLHGVIAINLISTPRAGKTSLLESTIPTLMRDYRIGVIASDLAAEDDVRRLCALRVPTIQVMTGAARHLDAHMVKRALRDIVTPELDLLFMESDGNLTCPACLSLGQHHNVALLSVADGDDRPQREPALFRAAELVVLTKTDLLPSAPQFDDLRLHRLADDRLRGAGSGHLQPAWNRCRCVLRMVARQGSAAVVARRFSQPRSAAGAARSAGPLQLRVQLIGEPAVAALQ